MSKNKTTTKTSTITAALISVAEWAAKVGITPKAARRQLRNNGVAGAVKEEGEWKVPQDAPAAERKNARKEKPAAEPKAPKAAKAPKADEKTAREKAKTVKVTIHKASKKQ